VLGGVSLLTDISSEMTYPLLPLFLTAVLGASATTLGAIEGAAETTAALLKLVSGWWSDRTTRRKPLVVAGYTLASVVRPLIGLTRTAWQVLAIRVADRVGKGIRTSPRDALIADSVDPRVRGRAFGLHRALDDAGATIGPLVAFALLRWGHGIDLRRVFLLTAVPAAAALALLVFGLREAPRSGSAPDGVPDAAPVPAPGGAGTAVAGRGMRGAALGGRFWAFLAVVFVFTLGNSSDAFLLLQASRMGVAAALVPILWALLNLVKALTTTHGGALSDRIGRRPPLIAGWLVYAFIYFAFGRAAAQWQAWALFALYGLYFGLTEGVQSALVADFVPAERRGAAYGWYNLAIGIGALPASLIFGALADRVGTAAAFTFGAVMALLAAIAILFVAPAKRAGDARPG
jgi:MFS family permease